MKKIILIIFLILSIGIGIIVINNQMNTSKNILASESKNALKANNAITMMYETNIGSGEYQTTTDTTWPQDGYIFNERLSGCENGSTLTWDNENKTVKMKASISDKCYLYFDKYDIPIINTVTASDTNYNSVTLTVNATSSTSTIAKYYYSKDDGNSYTESTNNTYTFSGLTANTTYDFKVYVEDANGITSKEYAISIDTSAYINPTISRVTTANIKYNSVTLNVTASAGTNNITRYYYSSNNGSTWVNSTSSSYTFNNLTAGRSYTFKVYVVDSANHKSSQYTITASTTATCNGITFKIGSKTYCADSGMTWREWVASDYNTAGLTDPGWGWIYDKNRDMTLVYDYSPVGREEVIVSGREYNLSYYGG